MTHLAPPVTVRSSTEAIALAADIKRWWREGGSPDTPATLEQYPDLAAFKSVVVDLAYEEFCLRRERGEFPDPSSFCGRMPADYRGSIGVVLQAHDLVEDHADRLTTDPVGWPERGGWVDGLQVIGELGRGSFARAYLTFDPETDRLCVLKLSATSRGEGRTLGRHAHPRITPVFWARRVDEFDAVCMPLLGAATLDQVRRRVFPPGSTTRPLSAAPLLDALESVPLTRLISPPAVSLVRRAASYANGVGAVALALAEALQYLHRKGARHGDLKPSNVVLGPAGHPYLIDFNLADPGDPAAVGGTLPYMAPEQLRALAGNAGTPFDPAAADVFAFGLVVAELLTGRPPLSSAPGLDMKAAAAQQLKLRRPSVWPADVPPTLAGLLDRCLADAPNERPSAAEVVAVLGRWLAPPPARRPGGKRSILATLGLSPLVALALALMLGGDKPAPEPPREPRTAREFFDRGRELLRRDRLTPAEEDFRRSNELETRAETLAFEAYTAARNGHHPTAWELNDRAIKDGVRTAAVYNNAGAAAVRLNLRKEAILLLDKALERSPDLTAAYYNRALARLDVRPRRDRRWAFATGEAACLKDIAIALEGPVPCAELYLTAARVYAAASVNNPPLAAEALKYLKKAADAGAPAAWLQDDDILINNLGSCVIETTFGKASREPPVTPHQLRLVAPE